MKRVVAVCLGTLAAVLISAAPAEAMEADTGSASIGIVPELPAPGTEFILGEKRTNDVVTALTTGGTGAAIFTCQTLMPAQFKDACTLIVGTLAAMIGKRVAPKAGMCMKITVKLGKPPFRVSYVPCPRSHSPGPAPEPGPRPEPGALGQAA